MVYCRETNLYKPSLVCHTLLLLECVCSPNMLLGVLYLTIYLTFIQTVHTYVPREILLYQEYAYY